MQVYAALYHAFMPPLYAGTLCQDLYQVYATRAPLGFIPSLSSSCKSLQHKKTSSKSQPYPQVFINPSILSNMFSLFRSEALRVLKAALASRTITSGTPVLMNSVRPWPRGGSPPGRPFSWTQFFPSTLYRLMPWHCSALCWCYVMLVACPGCAWGQHKASVKPAQDSGGGK